jgi:hypothetical protein
MTSGMAPLFSTSITRLMHALGVIAVTAAAAAVSVPAVSVPAAPAVPAVPAAAVVAPRDGSGASGGSGGGSSGGDGGNSTSSRHISAGLYAELEELARLVDIAYCVGTTGIAKPFLCASRCDDFPDMELVTVSLWFLFLNLFLFFQLLRYSFVCFVEGGLAGKSYILFVRNIFI